MDKHLHIVAFNVPWPADYGGVIDVFYRLRALSVAGVKVHLHCFCYGRTQAKELEPYCVEVQYYRRRMSPLLMLTDRRPFIVSSRDSKELKARLLQDDYPILLEGVHTCALLQDYAFAGRNVLVRAHNVEADYYRQLASVTPKALKRRYLNAESRRLQRYEGNLLRKAKTVLAVTEADKERFLAMGCHQVVQLTSSQPYNHVCSKTGRGEYALFHGNLEVDENASAVEYLISHVFDDGRWPLVVAGHNPSEELCGRVSQHENVKLVANPDHDTMQRMISEAQVNILFTGQPTGLKLKLLESLFVGRHCLVNSHMVAGTALGGLCTVADSPEAMRDALDDLMVRPFSDSDVQRRIETMQAYSPEVVNRKIVEMI